MLALMNQPTGRQRGPSTGAASPITDVIDSSLRRAEAAHRTQLVPQAAGLRRHGARERWTRRVWDEEYAELAAYCACVLGDEAAAHIVAQEAFIRLLSRWRTPRNPRGLLYETAANLVARSPLCTPDRSMRFITRMTAPLTR